MSAGYAPLFVKIGRHTDRYSTNVSSIYTPLNSTRSTCIALYIQRVLRTHFRDTYPQQICVNSHHNSPASRIQKRPRLKLHQKRVCAPSAHRMLCGMQTHTCKNQRIAFSTSFIDLYRLPLASMYILSPLGIAHAVHPLGT